jgi:hypothetical protein
MDTSPEGLERQKIPARLDRHVIARAMAEVVKAMLVAVETDQDDFWVNIDLDLHIQAGKALEKCARVNVYGEVVDPAGLCSAESGDENEVPSEVFRSFCEPTD